MDKRGVSTGVGHICSVKYVLTKNEKSLLRGKLRKACHSAGLRRQKSGYCWSKEGYWFSISVELFWDQVRSVTLGFTKFSADNSLLWDREGLESWSEQGGPPLLEAKVESMFPPQCSPDYDSNLGVWIFSDSNSVLEFGRYLESGALEEACILGKLMEDPHKLAHFVLRPPRDVLSITSRLGIYVCKALLQELDPTIQSHSEFCGTQDSRSTYDQDYLRLWLHRTTDWPQENT